VGLGFGLQKIAANYASGFIVLLDHSLRLGDTITIDGRRGELKEIASRYTVIRGGDGTESIVPNEKLITEIVGHHTYSDPKMAVAIPVTIGGEADVERACELLLEAARDDARVIPEPAAVARVKAIVDWGVQLELTAWTAAPGVDAALRSDIYRAVLKAFRAAGIPIAYPRRDTPSNPTPATK
jgi:small-conductance mechanosensitive channel